MPDYTGPLSITPDDYPGLVKLLNAVFREEGGDMSVDYKRHLAMSNAENIRVIKQGGKVVSHVGVSVRDVTLGGIPTRVAGIGAVATSVEARGQGFASMLMKDAIDRSRNQGADIMLISGDNGVYRGLHATECGSFPVVEVQKSPSLNVDDLTIREAVYDDLDAIVHLRQQQPTRYLLPREDIEALWESRWVMDKPSVWWVIAFGEEDVLGYVISWQDSETVHWLDVAGSHGAILAMLRHELQSDSVKTVRWIAQDESCIPHTIQPHMIDPVPFDGTVLVLHAERFLRRATPWLQERLGETRFHALQIDADADRVTFALKDERRTFTNGGELAQLFFGCQNQKPPGQISPLDDCLNQLFPVPLVWYGMGYV